MTLRKTSYITCDGDDCTEKITGNQLGPAEVLVEARLLKWKREGKKTPYGNYAADLCPKCQKSANDIQL